MSELAFDKEGNPFRFSRRTKKLRPRRWKNAGQRGTCAAVLDAHGEQLLIDADAEYLEFRTAVGNVAGFYRLDQCDEDGTPIDDAAPAYVSIESTRNAAPIGEVDPRDAVIRDSAQINADVTRTIAERFSNVMQAAADILRAADGAGLSRREPPPPAPPPTKEEDDDEEEDDEEDEEEIIETPPNAWAPIIAMILPKLSDFGAMLYEKLFTQGPQSNATTPPAAASSPGPAPAQAPAPNPGPEPVGATAGPSASAPYASAPYATAPAPTAPAPAAPVPAESATAPTATAPAATAPYAGAPYAAVPYATTPAAPVPTESPMAPIATAPTATAPAAQTTSAPTATIPAPIATAPAASAPTATAPSTSSSTTSAPTAGAVTTLAPVRNAPFTPPTPAQIAHLYAIHACLTPKEIAHVEAAMARMAPDMLAQWLADLSPLSVEEAVRRVRAVIAQSRAQRRQERG